MTGAFFDGHTPLPIHSRTPYPVQSPPYRTYSAGRPPGTPRDDNYGEKGNVKVTLAGFESLPTPDPGTILAIKNSE
jgi:hypothetical protein